MTLLSLFLYSNFIVIDYSYEFKTFKLRYYYAWCNAEIGVLWPEPAIEVLYKNSYISHEFKAAQNFRI
ncbi:hypothetical protein [Orientia tsutsugamushi]